MPLTRRAGVVFLCVIAYLGWLAASRFVFGMNDEGIYLDGGLRVLHGQIPYKDFFSITGPGTYVLLAASFRVFGTTLLAARIWVVWDIAIITACLFWLVSKLSNSTAAAALTAFLYLPFATLAETAVVANHRWDSSAWAILAGTLVVAASERPSAAVSLVAGIAAGLSAGLAAWCTPPVALAALALGACLVTYRATRRLFAFYAGGVAVAFAAGASWLASTGALPAMLDSLAWNASNYAGANRTWYGAVPGGYLKLLRGGAPVDAAVGIVLLAFFTLPATLPFFSAFWLWKRPSRTVVILLTLGAALVISTYPRWDLNHLTWVSVPFYALVAALIAPSVFRKPVAVSVFIAAGACLTVITQQRLGETTRVTNLGTVHGHPADLDTLAMIQARVKPFDTLFVFPYRPLLYFVTGAQNPTRYSYLQPGMFSDRDQSEVLKELRAQPPRWVFHAQVSPEKILFVWPGSDLRRMQMPGIEAFLRENYKESEQWADLHLLEEIPPTTSDRRNRGPLR